MNGETTQQAINRPHIPKHSRHGSLNRKSDHCAINNDGIQTELRGILKEIRVITNKIRAEVYFQFIGYIRTHIN